MLHTLTRESLYHYIAISLYCYITILLYHYIAISLYSQNEDEKCDKNALLLGCTLKICDWVPAHCACVVMIPGANPLKVFVVSGLEINIIQLFPREQKALLKL